jgi:hypothetical protein
MKKAFIKMMIVLLLVGGNAFAQKSKFRVLVLASRASDHIKMMAAAQPFFTKLAADSGFKVDYTDDTSKVNTANLRNYEVFVMLQLAPFDMSYAQQDALAKILRRRQGLGGHPRGGPYRQTVFSCQFPLLAMV